MKKGSAIILLTAMLASAVLTGCGNDKAVLSTALADVDLSGYTERLAAYDSPYTVGYRNKDGTVSLYIFSAPVQYKDGDGYALIDSTVIESENSGFAFQNKAGEIKTYFPAQADRGVSYRTKR